MNWPLLCVEVRSFCRFMFGDIVEQSRTRTWTWAWAWTQTWTCSMGTDMLLGHGHTAGVWTLSIDMKNCPSLRSGSKRSLYHKKIRQNALLYVLPTKKNNLLDFQNQRTAFLGSHISLRAPRHGGGPLCVLASRRWGPTYIASYTHTLGSRVDFSMKSYSRYCDGEISDHFGQIKKPLALPFAALHHPLWDYGIVFALQRDTAVAPGRGHSF
jgi:hypothetical protein